MNFNGICLYGPTYCTNKFGIHSIYKNNDCTCEDKYGFDLNRTKCELSDYYKKLEQPQGAVLGVQYSANNPLSLQNGQLIKNKKFVEVFSVDTSLCLHWIVNEKAAQKYFGKTWNQGIKEFDEIPGGYKYCENLN
jgi:hypothetical protein